MKRRSASSKERAIRAKRRDALERVELRTTTTPRESPSGPTSFPVKARNTESERLVSEFLARRV